MNGSTQLYSLAYTCLFAFAWLEFQLLSLIANALALVCIGRPQTPDARSCLAYLILVNAIQADQSGLRQEGSQRLWQCVFDVVTVAKLEGKRLTCCRHALGVSMSQQAGGVEKEKNAGSLRCTSKYTYLFAAKC